MYPIDVTIPSTKLGLTDNLAKQATSCRLLWYVPRQPSKGQPTLKALSLQDGHAEQPSSQHSNRALQSSCSAASARSSLPAKQQAGAVAPAEKAAAADGGSESQSTGSFHAVLQAHRYRLAHATPEDRMSFWTTMLAFFELMPNKLWPSHHCILSQHGDTVSPIHWARHA